MVGWVRPFPIVRLRPCPCFIGGATKVEPPRRPPGVFATSCLDARQVDFGGDDEAADGDAADRDDADHEDTGAKPMASAFNVDVGRSGVLFSTEVGVQNIAKMLELRVTAPGVAEYHDGLRSGTTPPVVMPQDVQKFL